MTADARLEPSGDPQGLEPPADLREAAGESESSSGFVDFRALILDEGSGSVATRLTETDENVEPGEDFKAALSRFRARLIRSLPSGDARTHQDMGTAYRTMGLGHEAIGEFQHAIREDPASPAAHEMLGRCFLDAGQPELAVGALAKALELPSGSEDDFLGIYYYMGRAQEASGNPEAAYDFYRKILAIDIGFQDVEARERDLGRALRRAADESADPAPGQPFSGKR